MRLGQRIRSLIEQSVVRNLKFEPRLISLDYGVIASVRNIS